MAGKGFLSLELWVHRFKNVQFKFLECPPSGALIGRWCMRIPTFELDLESMAGSVKVKGRPRNDKFSSK